MSWTDATAWAADSVYSGPDVSAALQEVVDRPGYAAGNALMLLVIDSGSSWHHVDSVNTGDPIVLDVTWSSAAKVPSGSVTATSPDPTVRRAVVPTASAIVSSPAPAVHRALVPAGVLSCASPAPSVSPQIRRSLTARRAIPCARALIALRVVAGQCRDLTVRRGIPGRIHRDLTASRAVPTVLVRTLAARRSILDHTPLCVSLTGSRAIPADDAAIRRSVSWSCVFDDDGAALDLVAAEISGDRESYAWGCTLTLGDEAAYQSCTAGRRLTLTLGGQPFALLLEGRSRETASGERGYSASARTVSCLLDDPYAAALTQSWPAITAKDAATALAGLAGLALTWEVCNWTLPAGRLTAEAETPATLLARLAASCGAVVLPDPAGGVVVRYAYPVGVPEMATATPRATLSDDADVLTLAETYVAAPGYNAVTVVDNRATTETYLSWELDSDRNAGRSTFPPGEPAYLRIYHEEAYAVRATLGAVELIQADIEESLTASVGFDDTDTASLGGLVLAVDSVQWFGPDLGSLVPAGGANVVASAGAGFSVASVTYRTRYDLWRLTAPAAADAFSVLLELSEADT